MTSTTPGSLYATALLPDMVAPTEIGVVDVIGESWMGAVSGLGDQGLHPPAIGSILFARKRCSGSYLPRFQATGTPFTGKEISAAYAEYAADCRQTRYRSPGK